MRGRRLAVEHLLGMLAAGDTVDAIVAAYSWLEADDVRACLVYARRGRPRRVVPLRPSGFAAALAAWQTDGQRLFSLGGREGCVRGPLDLLRSTRLHSLHAPLMYLLYLDDSGSSKNPKERHLVLGGLSLAEAQIHWVTQRLDELAQSIDPNDPQPWNSTLPRYSPGGSIRGTG